MSAINATELIAFNFLLEDAIEALNAMPEYLLAWVDFLVLGAVLLSIDNRGKLLGLLVLIIFLLRSLAACKALFEQKIGTLELTILILF